MWKLMSSQIFLPGFPSMSTQAGKGSGMGSLLREQYLEAGMLASAAWFALCFQAGWRGLVGTPLPFTTPTRNCLNGLWCYYLLADSAHVPSALHTGISEAGFVSHPLLGLGCISAFQGP